MGLTLKEMCDALERIDTPTKKTCDFEEQFHQSDNRWWECIEDDRKDFSKQKYHIHAHFLCCGYHGGKTPTKCPYTPCCRCYREQPPKRCNPDAHEFSNDVSAETIFNRLSRPEALLWFVEALQLLDENKLSECFNKAKDLWSKPNVPHRSRMKGLRDFLQKEYDVTWKTIENKLKGE